MRIKEIDILKGILIILVVIGHSTFEYARYAYWFHMPAFFMVSGFLYNSNNKNLKTYIKKKTISLLVPYISFLVLFTFLLLITNELSFDLKFLAKMLIGGKLLTEVFGVFWFITSLFFALIFFAFIIAKVERKTYIYMIIGLCFILAHLESFLIHDKKMNIVTPFNIDSSLIGVVYIYLGYCFKTKWESFKKVFLQYRIAFIIISFALLISVFSLISEFNFDMKYQEYGNIVYSIFIPCCITFSIFLLIFLLPKFKLLNQALTLAGKYSLLIMYLHLFFKFLFYKYDIYNLVLFIILSLILPIGISKLLERNKWTSLLFLGDNKK